MNLERRRQVKMMGRKEGGRGRRSRSRTSSSPGTSSTRRLRHDPESPRASLGDRDFFTFLQEGEAEADGTGMISTETTDYRSNPRSFPLSVKQQCWDKADKVKGRDPDRWRRDPLGNIVFRKLVGCPGCLCHDYDHILPYSKGGKSTLENCQVLQATVNRSKGNRTEISKADLIQKSAYCRVAGRDMDLLELSAYGNVRHGQDDSGGCNIQ